MPRIPTIKDVIPGASVNIVLKADQPTGRTVAGVVANLLTRGNHPRGIKVRLTDGRVGRVQSMVSGTETGMHMTSASASASAPAPAAMSTTQTTTSESGLPSENVSLDAYITRGKPRQNGKGGGKSSKKGPVVGREEEDVTQSSDVVICPVCGEFNGDEVAVAHHVESHFND